MTVETVEILVIGGGITGQLVALHCAPTKVVVIEAREAATPLTRSYGANYLWKPISFAETVSFPVVTHVDGKPGTRETILRYKNKIGKPEDEGNWGLQFEPDTLGYGIVSIPPVTIHYGCSASEIDLHSRILKLDNGHAFHYKFLVSTIPLNELVKLNPFFNQKFPLESMFPYRPIHVLVTSRPPDAPYHESVVYVNYLSNPNIDCYRFCDRNGERHYEGLTPMGRLPSKKLYPGKIKFHPQVRELLATLSEFNITCFGRYGKWSPDELVHETSEDIEQWAKNSISVV